MKLDLQDYCLRFLVVLAGGLSAILLVMQGWGPALPGLAIGGTLGAFAIARLESARE